MGLKRSRAGSGRITSAAAAPIARCSCAPSSLTSPFHVEGVNAIPRRAARPATSLEQRPGVGAVSVGMIDRLRCLGVLLALCCCHSTRAAESGRELWLYYPANLLVDRNIDKLQEIWTRAAAAGYTHVLLADSKFSRLNGMDRHYFGNVERTQKIAAELKLTIVPALFPIGYSNDLLTQDPNLAEGLPVKDALFIVKDDTAQLKADPAVAFRPKFDFIDQGVQFDAANQTATVSDNSANARLNQ